jgi:uncharacterized protein YggE
MKENEAIFVRHQGYEIGQRPYFAACEILKEKLMRVLNAFVLSALLCLPMAGASWAEAQITVTGEATVQSTPDMATVMLGVTTNGATAAAAMTANNAALAAVFERLKSFGIEERDLQTSNLSVNPNWIGYDTATPTIAGYIATNMLNVRVRDLTKVGEVLDASIADGANTLNGINFEVANPRPIMDEARKAAVLDARARAELLATAAGVTLGKVISINEQSGYGGPMPMFRASADAAVGVPIASGQVGLGATVIITFALNE